MSFETIIISHGVGAPIITLLTHLPKEKDFPLLARSRLGQQGWDMENWDQS